MMLEDVSDCQRQSFAEEENNRVLYDSCITSNGISLLITRFLFYYR